MNLPIAMTLVRIAAIPLICLLYFMHTPWAHFWSGIAYVVVAITDLLDGYIARSRSQTSRFGAFLDPVADKLLVSTILVLLLSQNLTPWLWLPAAIIIGREITVSALREWMAEVGKRTHVAVMNLAKIKTFLLNMGMPFLLWYHADMYQVFFWRIEELPLLVLIIGLFLLTVASVLTIWTMLAYLRAAWPDL